MHFPIDQGALEPAYILGITPSCRLYKMTSVIHVEQYYTNAEWKDEQCCGHDVLWLAHKTICLVHGGRASAFTSAFRYSRNVWRTAHECGLGSQLAQ